MKWGYFEIQEITRFMNTLYARIGFTQSVHEQ